jgi:septum formation topological specificity factor MinE
VLENAEELSARDATELKAVVAEDASAAVPATLANVRRDILPIE